MGRWVGTVSPYIAFSESVDRLLLVLLRLHVRGKAWAILRPSSRVLFIFRAAKHQRPIDRLATVVRSLMSPPPL